MRAMRRHHCTRQKAATATGTAMRAHAANVGNVWRPTRRMKLQFKVINTCSVGAKSQLSCEACAATDSVGAKAAQQRCGASCALQSGMGARLETGRHSESDPPTLNLAPPLTTRKAHPPLCPFVSEPFCWRLSSSRSLFVFHLHAKFKHQHKNAIFIAQHFSTHAANTYFRGFFIITFFCSLCFLLLFSGSFIVVIFFFALPYCCLFDSDCCCCHCCYCCSLLPLYLFRVFISFPWHTHRATSPPIPLPVPVPLPPIAPPL